MPAIPEPPERIADDVIALREIAEWDIPETLIAFQDDPDLHRRLGLAEPPTGAQLGTEVDHRQQRRLEGVEVKLTIVERDDNDWRGRVEVTDFDWARGQASMRVWVAPYVRGRAYEDHAVALAAGWLFDSVAVDRLAVVIDGEDSGPDGVRTLARERARNGPASPE